MRISNQTTETKNRIQESGYKKAGRGMRDAGMWDQGSGPP